MTVQIGLGELLTLIIAAMGLVIAGWKLFFSQIDKRLDVRFTDLDAKSVEVDKRLDTKFAALDESSNSKFTSLEKSTKLGDEEIRNILTQHINDESKNRDQLLELERQMLHWKADLPLQYVRREDFIRNQTIIESKLDGLACKIENAQLRGGNNVG